MENQLLREESVENKRLRELLSFRDKFSYDILPAEIVGRDPSSWFKTILINRGKSDGVVRGAGVITPQGVVGRVIDITTKTSKVLLITDINSSIDAVIKRSRERGIVEGYTQNNCKLSYVLKTEDVRQDDIIVTSGLHDIFPKGVLIGNVIRFSKNRSGFFQFIDIKPSVDFTKLNEVLIVLNDQKQ